MERYLLITLFLALSGCQVTELIPADRYEEPLPTNQAESLKTYSDVWERIIEGNRSKKVELNEKTLKYINAYLEDTTRLSRLLEKGRYFIFFVMEELEKYDLPPELALLPYIESNYDPFSISSSGAMGIWQFMPATGRIYGLEDTWWYEERHDPIKSTEAAVKYLAYLHNRFNKSLDYTLAAYNGGPTLLEKRIKENKHSSKSVNYKDLRLPNQTKEYVPKFNAILELVLNADKYGIKLPDIPNTKALGQIELNGQIEIMAFSDFANLKPEFVYKLNAGFTKWASPPGKKTVFNVPFEMAQDLRNRKDQFVQDNQITWVTHKVSAGDSLWKIASKYGTEVGVLKKVNYLKREVLSVNQELLIPLSNDDNHTFIPYQAHIVSEGDTLWGLSIKYGMSVKEIARNSDIDPNSALRLGKELNIGSRNIHRTIKSKKRTILYSVKQGDSLYRIADVFNIEIADILAINEIQNNQIKPGQVIKIIIKAF